MHLLKLSLNLQLIQNMRILRNIEILKYFFNGDCFTHLS